MNQWTRSTEVVNHVWNKLKRKLYVKKILADYKKKGCFFINKNRFDAGTPIQGFISKNLFPRENQKNILDYAHKITENKIKLFSSYVGLGSKIDWQKDYLGGYKWNHKKTYLVKKFVVNNGSDPKVPWEISKSFQYTVLGIAYSVTKDDNYALKIQKDISDWIDLNPVGYGINWASPMESAVRVVNWIWAYSLIKDCKKLQEDFLSKWLQSLSMHGKYLSDFLRLDKPGHHNHIIGDYAGLIHLGIFFKDTREGKKWLHKGLEGLAKEVKIQINDEGIHYEGSIGYHRFVTEMLLSTVLYCRASNISVPSKIEKKTQNMLEFIMNYAKPDGLAPIIGDSDDGRWFNLGLCNSNDHRYLLALGAILFGRGDFKAFSNKLCGEVSWLLNEGLKEKYENLHPKPYNPTSRAYPKSGFYVMRKDDLYMFICRGYQNEPKKTGHFHNDTLSFELYAKDKAFIIDPGTYVYTSYPRCRNKFRSTAYHNTVVIDGKEQNEFSEKGVFGLKSFDAIAKLNKWESNGEYDFFDAEHYGYHKLSNPVTHRRQIYFNKKDGYWIIKDILTGEGIHTFDLYFHFEPMKLEQDKDDPLIIKTKCKGWNIALIPLNPDGLTIEIIDGWISYSYGTKVKAPVVRYSKIGIVPTTFLTVLYLYKEEIDFDKAKRNAFEFMNNFLDKDREESRI